MWKNVATFIAGCLFVSIVQVTWRELSGSDSSTPSLNKVDHIALPVLLQPGLPLMDEMRKLSISQKAPATPLRSDESITTKTPPEGTKQQSSSLLEHRAERIMHAKGGAKPFSFRFPMLAPDERMWDGHPGKDISVCVVVRTWAGHSHALGSMLASLAAAAHRKVSVHLIDTGRKSAFTSLQSIVEEFNGLVGFEMAKVSPRTSNSTRPLFRAVGDMEDWGYISTDVWIGDMVRWNAEAAAEGKPKPCMTFYFTNGDNLMARVFFIQTLDAIARGHNMVATNFIHHVADHQLQGHVFKNQNEMETTTACGGWRPGIDMEFFTQFRPNCVDLASVVSNASMWERDESMRFITPRLGKRGMIKAKNIWIQLYIADGTTFHRLASEPDANPHFVRRALIMHQ
jgi:hypothetical protein